MTTESTTRRVRVASYEARLDLDRFETSVVPPVLEKLLADEPALERWRIASERRGEQRARVTKARRELEQAKHADARAERDAARGPRPEQLRKPKAPRAQGRLEDEQARLAHLNVELGEAARALVAATGPYLERAAREAARIRDAADAEIDRAIDAVREALERKAMLAAEAVWVDQAVWDTHVHPWAVKPALPPRLGQAFGTFKAEVEEQRARARAHRAQIERERAAEFSAPGVPRDLRPIAPTPEKVVTAGGRVLHPDAPRPPYPDEVVSPGRFQDAEQDDE